MVGEQIDQPTGENLSELCKVVTVAWAEVIVTTFHIILHARQAKHNKAANNKNENSKASATKLPVSEPTSSQENNLTKQLSVSNL